MSETDMLEITSKEVETILASYVRRIPVPVAVRSTMRLMALSKFIPPGSTIIDVGCGDGCFGSFYPTRAELVIDGLDLNQHEAHLAMQTGAYRKVELCDISQQVPEGEYDIALGNCSLEHVPDIHAAFANIHKVVKPGGKFLLSVPAFGWTQKLDFIRVLNKFSTRIALCCGHAIDGFFQHHHLYDGKTWKMLVENHGFRVENVVGIGGPVLNQTFERGLPLAFIEFLYKAALKRYPGFTKGLRSLPAGACRDEIAALPISPDSPFQIEYVLEAIKPS